MLGIFKLLLAAIHLVIVDAITKELAIHHLKGAPSVSLIPGIFDLAYVENRGCAWGMFQGHVWPLALFGALALAIVLWRRKDFFFLEGPLWVRRTSTVAECLLYAGIIGNMIDRIFRGAVVDFLSFHWFDAWYFPCFNVADIAISSAAILLVFLSFAAPNRKGERK